MGKSNYALLDVAPAQLESVQLVLLVLPSILTQGLVSTALVDVQSAIPQTQLAVHSASMVPSFQEQIVFYVTLRVLHAVEQPKPV